MSHYEERLQTDLDAIRERVNWIGERVTSALDDALRALLTGDHTLAYDVVLGDLEINRAVRANDRRCHAFVARHLPSAGHLRFVSSVLRLNVELERIGDYAVTISREAVQLSSPPPETVARDVELIAGHGRRLLDQALQAFHERNADLARATIGLSGEAKAIERRVYRDLIREGEERSRPIRDLFSLLMVLSRLGRVADQAKNLCEETVFAETGETKAPKVYRILFLDRANDGLSQMAAAYGRKAFPEEGAYDSAGWQPATRVDPALVEQMAELGYDLRGNQPSGLPATAEKLASYHLIVSLEGDPAEHLGEIPFHTAVRVWDLEPQSGEAGAAPGPERYRAALRNLSVEMRELMDVLHGQEAG